MVRPTHSSVPLQLILHSVKTHLLGEEGVGYLFMYEAGRQQREFGKRASKLMGGWSPRPGGKNGGGEGHDRGERSPRSCASVALPA